MEHAKVLDKKVKKTPKNLDQRIQDIKVLMYHRLLSDREAQNHSHWTGVSISDFEEHLKMLESFNFTPITFNDLRLHLNEELQLPKKPVIITFDDGYKDFYELGYPLMQKYGFRAVVFALGDRSIRENIWDDPNEVERVPLMSDEELIKISENGFEIGAHSCTHPRLTTLKEKDLDREIKESKENLESLLGKEVYSFCYPYGLENMKVRQAVKNAGFDFGCTVYTGPLRFGESLHNIHRITIKNGMGALSFAMRMLTPFEYIEIGGSKIKKKLKSLS